MHSSSARPVRHTFDKMKPFRLLYRGAKLWLSTILLIGRWSLRLVRYLGLNIKWMLVMLRLVAFAGTLAVPFAKMVIYYVSTPSLRRGVRYGHYRRNDFDVYNPPEGAHPFSFVFEAALSEAVAYSRTTARRIGTSDAAEAHEHVVQSAAKARAVQPTFIFVAGGAWAIGYKAWGAAFARSLAAAGVRVVAPDYRNFPQARISAMVDDVDKCTEVVLAMAAGLHGHHGRLSWGKSPSPFPRRTRHSTAGVARSTSGSTLHSHGSGGSPDAMPVYDNARYVYLSGQSAGAHLAACVILERAVRRANAGVVHGSSDNAADGTILPPVRRFIGISGPYDVLSLASAMAKRGVSGASLLALFEGDLGRHSPARYVEVLAQAQREQQGPVVGMAVEQESQEATGEEGGPELGFEPSPEASHELEVRLRTGHGSVSPASLSHRSPRQHAATHEPEPILAQPTFGQRVRRLTFDAADRMGSNAIALGSGALAVSDLVGDLAEGWMEAAAEGMIRSIQREEQQEQGQEGPRRRAVSSASRGHEAGPEHGRPVLVPPTPEGAPPPSGIGQPDANMHTEDENVDYEEEDDDEEDQDEVTALAGSPGPVEATAPLSSVVHRGMGHRTVETPARAYGFGTRAIPGLNLGGPQASAGFSISLPAVPEVDSARSGRADSQEAILGRAEVQQARDAAASDATDADTAPYPIASPSPVPMSVSPAGPSSILSHLPSITLLHGAADDSVDAGMSHLFAGALHRAGVTCCGHGRGAKDPGQQQEESIMSVLFPVPGNGGTGGSGRSLEAETRGAGPGPSNHCGHKVRVRIFPGATHTDPVLEGALSAGFRYPHGHAHAHAHAPGPQGPQGLQGPQTRADGGSGWLGMLWGVGAWIVKPLLALPALAVSAASAILSALWQSLPRLPSSLGARNPRPAEAGLMGMGQGLANTTSHDDAGLSSGDAILYDVIGAMARDILADHGLLGLVLAAHAAKQAVQQPGQDNNEAGGPSRARMGSGCAAPACAPCPALDLDHHSGDVGRYPLPVEMLDLTRARQLAPPLAPVWLCTLARWVNPF